jgi:hypothetical protein
MQIDKLEESIRIILAKEFKNDHNKQIIYKAGNRLNFSCPYCGDSKDGKKKRGNFYLDTLAYKCYNGGCGIYKNSTNMFKDFSVYDTFSDDEKDEMKSIIDTNHAKHKSSYGKIDISFFFDNDISDILIDRDAFMAKLRLQEISGSSINRYVTRRYQKPDRKFAWDPKKEKLFLFNLTPSNKILGLQVRNMHSINGSSKYLTYKLSGIYEKLLGIKDIEILEKARSVDPISNVFGIGDLDFGLEVTVFEGPMDSWLWPNSVGMCSIENRFPFDIENKRYWYDWDKAGIGKSMELLGNGETVFNWGKFLEENNITKNRKWDLNDLVIHLRKLGKKIKRLDQYFTNDILDIGYFINA